MFLKGSSAFYRLADSHEWMHLGHGASAQVDEGYRESLVSVHSSSRIPKESSTLDTRKDMATSAKKVSRDYPSASKMVASAIAGLSEGKKGSSSQAIRKYIKEHFPVDMDKQNRFIRNALIAGVKNGQLIQTKGKGAAGSYRLDTTKEKAKAAAKAKAEKEKERAKAKQEKEKAKKAALKVKKDLKAKEAARVKKEKAKKTKTKKSPKKAPKKTPTKPSSKKTLTKPTKTTAKSTKPKPAKKTAAKKAPATKPKAKKTTTKQTKK